MDGSIALTRNLAPAARQESPARAWMRALAARGVALTLTVDGTSIVSPRGGLNERDREIVSQHRGEIIAVLADTETPITTACRRSGRNGLGKPIPARRC